MVIGDPPRKNDTRFMRAICNPRVKVRYRALYNIDHVTPVGVDAFVNKVGREMRNF
jgi:hypothetical protein